jgi:very-short-patch-repair endonuclease
MRQPAKIKTVVEVEKPVEKRNKKTQKQPLKNEIKFWAYHKIATSSKKEETHPNVTTSKLEVLFKEQFLDKLGIRYIYQWQAPTKRVYDFAILTRDGGMIDYLIEIQGTFYHADPRFYDHKNLKYNNQKKQIIIDEQKQMWANMNGFVLLQIYEEDIKKNPKKVLEMLKARSECSNH